MPGLFSFASLSNDDALQELDSEPQPSKRLRGTSLLRRPLSLLRRQNAEGSGSVFTPCTAPTELPPQLPQYITSRRPSLPENLPSRRVVPSLPRPQTFLRQESERRERLLEIQPTPTERRTLSVDRRRSRGLLRALSPIPIPITSLSLSNVDHSTLSDSAPTCPPLEPLRKLSLKDLPPLQIPDQDDRPAPVDEAGEHGDDEFDKSSVEIDFERRWILNLSMHFRDKSNREKFFVTYAETPNKWRRLTISLDYRDAPPDSLESELGSMKFQRDKSLRIYEAIRDSLHEIQYYDTVTNLKLDTTREDGQLHVHVREDANEIIHYPSISLFGHVGRPRFGESSLEFVSHLSGFVYKVRVGGRVLIKKEIPGPDTVDEFMYEVNALDSLLGADNVVQLEGLVTDDRGELVKGLLISYASEGSLVDMIYDFRGTSQLPWHRREKWAKQIVTGLSEVHEAGFVQGDFTLSNIVIDEDDNAQIIDINRRGCPVGWEPPELGRLIDSGQRIGMCIGVKTDLFQLGMCLWALAEEVDEPERVERPLPDLREAVPDYFRDVVRICLSEKPQGRMGAKQLLRLFPDTVGSPSIPQHVSNEPNMHVSDHSDSTATHRSAKEYIDPKLAMTIDDLKERRRSVDPSDFQHEQVTYVNPDSNPASSIYRFESSGSWMIGRSRGRSPASSRRRRSSPCVGTLSSATSLSEDSPMRGSKVVESFNGDVRTPQSSFEATVSSVQENASEYRPQGRCVNRRVTNLQGSTPRQIAELVHIDSGFDETMYEPDLDNSCLTERRLELRYRTEVPDDKSDPASRCEEKPTQESCKVNDKGAEEGQYERWRDRTISTSSIETERRVST